LGDHFIIPCSAFDIKKMNGNSVEKVKNNISLMLSNLYYRMKRMVDFIKGSKWF